MNKEYTTSPFPGMNPYLEGPVNWSDFHATFIHALREALGDVLREPYFAKINELVMMVAPEIPPRKAVEPDVLIGRAGDGSISADPSGSAVAVLEPVSLCNIELLDLYTEPFIEILRLPDTEPVTVIGLFSPTNKYGDGRGAYTEKRNRLLRSRVNLFELDLTRAGPRLQLDRKPPDDHYLCYSSRSNRRPTCDVYSWSIRQLLPALPVPLRWPDPDVQISLAEPFKVAFARGRYGRFIDYKQPPPPPKFSESDDEWIKRISQAS